MLYEPSTLSSGHRGEVTLRLGALGAREYAGEVEDAS